VTLYHLAVGKVKRAFGQRSVFNGVARRVAAVRCAQR